MKALDDAGLGDKSVDAVYVAIWAAECSNTSRLLPARCVDRLSLLPAAAETIENGPASGASAVKTGCWRLPSGYYDTVLVSAVRRCVKSPVGAPLILWPP